MAISGMTGFARVEGAAGAWTWTVEARSVNGRGLEVRFRGPPGFDLLERAARDAGQARFQRGQLTVALQAKRAEASGAVRVNQTQLNAYLDLSATLVGEGRAALPTVDGLLALRGVIEVADDADDAETRAGIEAAMTASLVSALDGLRLARLEEGAALLSVLTGLVDRIEALVASAESGAAEQPALLKARFARRLTELVGERADLDDRIVQEAAVLAGKADVREELDRLVGHVAAARTLLGGDGQAGRRLDFLTQEFMREANTLCSKAATANLTTIGLELKAVIDQLREQVQNVE
jgi:uncharacterized protein (TIGR00255 family)